MSFSSGSVNYPSSEPKLAGMSSQRLATAEQGRPLPVFWGQRRIGLTFISAPFNQVVEPVTQTVSKKEDPITVGYNYYCDFAALLCHGPVDRVVGVYLDDELVWSGDVSRSGTSHNLTIDGYGTLALYWGTEAQGIDLELAKLSASSGERSEANAVEEHPAYKGQCYVVARQFFLGYQRTQVPNIELVLARYPTSSWLTGADNIGNDASIPRIVVDALTHPRYGLGLPDTTDTFYRAGIQAVQTALIAEGVGLSPIIDRVQSCQDWLIELLDYFDLFYASTPGGQLTMGMIRAVPCNDPEDIPTIDETCLTDPPEINVESIDQTSNEVRLSFTNADAGYQEDSLTAVSQGNLQSLGTPSQTSMQRPWITSPAVADRVARSAVKAFALPKVTGTLRVLRSKLQGLTLGSGFYLSYSHYSLCWMHCRVTAVNWPDPHSPEAVLTFEEDRGFANSGYYTPPAYTPPQKPANEPEPITSIRIVECPYYHATVKVHAATPYPLILAARPTKLTNSAVIWAVKWEDTWARAGMLTSWADHGTLDDVISVSSNGPITITVDSVDDLETDVHAQSPWKYDWIAFVGNEILGIDSVTPLGNGKYSLGITREGMDTVRAAHAIGSDVFIIRCEHVPGAVAKMDAFNKKPGDTLQLRIQPSVGKQFLGNDEMTTQTLAFAQRTARPWPPKSLSGPASYTGAESGIAITWQPVNREGGTSFEPSYNDNPYWCMDVRAASAPWSWINPVTGQVLYFEKMLSTTATRTIEMSQLLARLGGAVSFKVRMWAQMKDFTSANFTEITVNKV
jgi:hypothetical protein